MIEEPCSDRLCEEAIIIELPIGLDNMGIDWYILITSNQDCGPYYWDMT